MMSNLNITKNIKLAPYTSFNIGGNARYFLEIKNPNEIEQALKFATQNNLKILIMGGGSNMLISDNGFDGLVLHINNKGYDILEENKEFIRISVQAGETWDDFVKLAVKSDWYGIENMSYIPGKIGGITAQNAGAYGQEAKESINEVNVFDLIEKKYKTFKKDDCQFNYRSSIFNNKEKKRYIIFSTTFKLLNQGTINTNYPDVKKYFIKHKIYKPSLKQIRTAIINIREAKFPHPPKMGSAGSFFKNIIITAEEFKLLQKKIKSNFDDNAYNKLMELKNKFRKENHIKIPTAFLIDICGLKGFNINGAKVHPNHALAIVNSSGKTTAQSVLELMQHIRQTVFDKTGIIIKPEVHLIGFSKKDLSSYCVRTSQKEDFLPRASRGWGEKTLILG